MYKLKEVYYTIQGEGAHSGRPAIFCRFSGCNLWTGREEDREKAICNFCDTDFVGTDGKNGGSYTAEQLTALIWSLWPKTFSPINPYIICTGGEPGLQVDDGLVEVLHEANIEIGIETNGTIELPEHIDWVCMSPKADTKLLVTSGDELKVVYPQKEIDPENFSVLQFKHFFLQPMDGPNIDQNTKDTIAYCMKYPMWKLSVQTHKYLGID